MAIKGHKEQMSEEMKIAWTGLYDSVNFLLNVALEHDFDDGWDRMSNAFKKLENQFEIERRGEEEWQKPS